jgi:hypothetical protein
LRRAAVVSSLVTISCLDLILLLGVGLPDRTSIRPLFNGLVLTLVYLRRISPSAG